jgi:hypothetical protein
MSLPADDGQVPTSYQANFPARTWRRTLLVVACWLLGCSSVREVPLRTLPDLVDRPDSAETAKQHPAGLDLAIDAVLAERATGAEPERSLPERSLVVTMRVVNDTVSGLELPCSTFELADDDGRRYALLGAHVWLESAERYEPAPAELAAGSRTKLVLTFRAGPQLDLQHVLELRLRWRYQHSGRKHAVLTRFRTGR